MGMGGGDRGCDRPARPALAALRAVASPASASSLHRLGPVVCTLSLLLLLGAASAPSPAELQSYAHDTVRAQQEHNSRGDLPFKSRQFKESRRGRALYWDLPQETLGLAHVGRREGSPFLLPNGMVRL